MRSQLEAPLEMLRGLSPDLVRQVLPVFDQLLPLYMDVANGKEEFIPSPSETRQLLRSNYGNHAFGSPMFAIHSRSPELCSNKNQTHSNSCHI